MEVIVTALAIIGMMGVCWVVAFVLTYHLFNPPGQRDDY